jgi:hypothetical protein
MGSASTSKVKCDGKQQQYIEVGTSRVTYVRAKERPRAKNWPKKDVIRIQAYVNAKDGRLHRGAEIPVNGPVGLFAVVELISQLAQAIQLTEEQSNNEREKR